MLIMEFNKNKTYNGNGINADDVYDYATEGVGNIQHNRGNFAYVSNNVEERPTPKTPINNNSNNNNSNNNSNE